MTKLTQKLTKAQIKEFWEWCGVVFIPKKEDMIFGNVKQNHWDLRNHLLYPDGTRHLQYPPIDLNNLFKYAVVKLQDNGYMVELYSYEHKGYKVSVYNITGQVDIPVAITTNEDPALALFWAIWEALK